MAVDSGTSVSVVDLQTPTGTLSGTLVSAGKTAALIIAGSGPTDRDGNSTLNLRSNVYKMLAEGLAGRHQHAALRQTRRRGKPGGDDG